MSTEILVEKIVSPLAAENAYVVAAGKNSPAIIIDPGQGAAAALPVVLDQHNLTLEAVVLTHGHLDHTWDVAEVADKFSIPTYIHNADRPQLSDPISWLSPEFAAIVSGLEGNFREPHDVVELEARPQWSVAGLTFQVLHVPGHTAGSLVYGINEVLFGGDVLFREGIGRTDLPGGNHALLVESIRSSLFTLPENLLVYPGHGPTTTIGHEKSNNPFVKL